MSEKTEKNQEFKLPVKKVTGETLEERLTENAYKRILPARYLQKDRDGETTETPEEMFMRVAENIAQPDKEHSDADYRESKEDFYSLMTELKFIPNSPTLMNAGTEIQQLSACFVTHPKDNMDSIFSTVHKAAKIFQSGGGMGYPFHLLRPKGDVVKSTGGIASGPLTFQQVFDTMCGTIKQGGRRRGAQMGIMKVDHPDILRFIVSKRKEGNLSNFNISVGVTQEFMEAVKNDEEYELTNPRTGDTHIVTDKTAEFYNKDEEWWPEAQGSDTGRDENFWRDYAHTFGDEIKKHEIDLEPGEEMTLPARFIWKTMVDGAWRNGEPGLFMIDQTNKMHSFDTEKHPEHRIEATNPCITGDTYINTDRGFYTAKELYEENTPINVVVDSRKSKEKIKPASRVYKTGTKDVYKIKTKEGFELRVTEDHKIMTEKGWKETRELQKGDKIHIQDREGVHNNLHQNENTASKTKNKVQQETENGAVLLKNNQEKNSYSRQTGFPEQMLHTGIGTTRRFLQQTFKEKSLINLDKNPEIKLKGENEFLKKTQLLLINQGIYSEIKNHGESYLVIKNEDVIEFNEKIGLLGDKKKLLQNLDIEKTEKRRKHTAEIQEIVYDGHEDVYDLTEPDTHSFIANGVVVHNCGEQPLENFEACNLGHINLSLLVEEKEDGQAQTFREWRKKNPDYDYESNKGLEKAVADYLREAMDMEEFERVARIGTRFLDNVITMNDFPLEEIEDKVSRMRKIGLGLMGFAQLLIQLGIRYGSRESIAVAKEIQRLITRFSVEESHRLALSRGEFPQWSESKWADPTEYPEWFERHTGGLNPEEYSDGYLIRNHNTTSIAPTGTTSMIANTSGGCEPIFSLAYFKNVAKDIQGEDMLVEFDDYFLKTLEANNIDVETVKSAAIEKMEENKWEGVDSIPDEHLPPEIKEIFVTADRVKPEEHVDIQAAFQYNNHSGISKTCNFPNEATKKDVEKAYMRAYEKGVKGMTVYRDGSREVQVMKTSRHSGAADLDKQDLIAKLLDEFGGIKNMIESKEFKEAIEQKSIDKDQEKPIIKTLTQEYGEDREGGEKTSMDGKTARDRPKVVQGETREIETPYGDLYVTINEDKHGPFEVFAQIGKAGGYTQSFTEALGRMISLSLRTGASGEEVIKQLDDIRSPQIAWDQGTKIYSVPDAIAEAMKRHLNKTKGVQKTVDTYEQQSQQEMEKHKDNETDTTKIIKEGVNPECPECGGMLTLQEGCKKCPGCGWSEC
ncbi:ribonucleotide reductase N-terminal alpha domain-containing protein [Methanonatronarchaeum sp. AMET6-2]|uniref:ribonucleotide reductase N-terminal alpha domain-containing protein n=1 Tax=Methanonatronarchaeum sp. AMET6-2 TaxID=2933293 RepID=UPI001205EBB0|nr:ribonucleotide reductase N-terminal alpha domain-containing protein [Methanonatronarchaeum sp. AMET6-2]RZN62933.1 MAG: ribonucleoside-diphosphate reductase [Methanonatronarchaeia archaeon]